MKEKKLTPILICNIIFMILLGIVCLISAISLIIGKLSESALDVAQDYMFIYAFVNISNAIALACGIVYLFNGYGKSVADYYKLFLIYVAVNSLLIAGAIFIAVGFVVEEILLLAKIVLLVVLAMWKNLGKTKSWIVFILILGLDIALFITTLISSEISIHILVSLVTSLALDGIIAIAIQGKYRDKAIRGTK